MTLVLDNPTEKLRQGRIEALRAFREMARSVDLRDDESFRKLLSEGQNLLELSDQVIADAILVSRPTVNRWVRGKNLPHRAMRKPIALWFTDQLNQKLKVLERAA